MRYVILSSGSKGNATLVESSAGDKILIDCGISVSNLKKRLAVIDEELESISAVFLTHEHQDHSQCAATLARKLGIPLFLTQGTLNAEKKTGRVNGLEVVEILNCHQSLTFKSFSVQPVVVPHDANEPCQFVIESNGLSLGILTDLGKVTPYVIEQYNGCDALILEANHDSEMLQVGPYPAKLKQRVGGNFGHLNNHQSADFLVQMDTENLKSLTLAHISEHNNCVERVKTVIESIEKLAGCEIQYAEQNEVKTWVDVSKSSSLNKQQTETVEVNFG